jgi:hypothetical protein
MAIARHGQLWLLRCFLDLGELSIVFPVIFCASLTTHSIFLCSVSSSRH